MKEKTLQYLHRKHIVKKKKLSFDSLKFQTLKSLSKLIKVLKGLLIQKTIRKISSCKTQGNSGTVDILESKLVSFKAINHNELSQLVFDKHKHQFKLYTGQPDSDNSIESTELSSIADNYFMKNDKVVAILIDYKDKYDELMAEKQKAEQKARIAKPNGDRSIGEPIGVRKFFLFS